MSFWNNPENNSLKTVLIIILVVIAGYFVYKYMQNNSLGGEGRVININNPGMVNVTPTSGTEMRSCEHANTFQTISGDCVYINGSCEVKDVHTGACDGKEKVPASVRPSTGGGASNPSSGSVPAPQKGACKLGLQWTTGGNCVNVITCDYVEAAKGCDENTPRS